MFTSATDTDRKANLKSAVIYLGWTAFCGFFSSVYGKFSHGVSSDYMVFLCLIPFLAGCLPYYLLYALKLKAPHTPARQLYDCGIATLAAGSCLTGVFEIYGSPCVFVPYYFIVGAILSFCGVTAYFIKR